MRVFVTGASGFIGSAVVADLVAAGHQVVGLARSDASAAAVTAAGARVHRGSLEGIESLREAAAAADGVAHLAFIHDFANYEASAAADRNAIEAMAKVLAGSNKPLVVTSGTALIAPGRLAAENDAGPDPSGASVPRQSEVAAFAFAPMGVRASAVRLAPTVHGDGDHGFVPMLIEIARNKGVSAYVGDGQNRWPAVHRFDAAQLFRLALEKAPAGSRLHGVAEEGIATKTIAETIGKQLGVPVVSVPAQEAHHHFGFLGAFFALDCPASNAITRDLLGWNPQHRGLIEDLERGAYFPTAAPAV